MYSGLDPSTLADFQAIVAPFVDQVESPTAIAGTGDIIRNGMRERCRAELVTDGGGWPLDALFRLRKVVETAYHLGRARSGEWQLLWEITEALSNAKRCRPLSDKSSWQAGLAAAVEALNHSSFRHSMIEGSREEIVARAFTALKRKGYAYTLDGRGALLAQPSFRKMCAKIEDKISRVGGLRTANAMLALMQRLGRIEDGSLLHARTPTMTRSKSNRPTGTPWHFIYNAALKHFTVAPTVINAESVLTDMEELARNLAAALNVEPHSTYENMHIAGVGLSGLLHEITLYDELFAFPQWQPSSSATLVPLWLDALVDGGCRLPTLTHDQWKSVTARILARSQPAAIVAIDVNNLVSSSVSRDVAATALEFLSHNSVHLNHHYRTPIDTLARNSTQAPIVRTKEKSFFVQPSGVAARALCERLYTIMRAEGDVDIENKMGSALERLTISLLEQYGIRPTIINGRYTGYPKDQGPEIDLATETDDRIFLIECTKKPLTNDARRGATLSALRDIEGSFLKLVQQLAGHEAELRTKGAIRFVGGEVLELKGRAIEKIGVSLFDHGSLQNRDFTIAFIEAMAGAQISIDASEGQDVAKSFNKRLYKLDKNLKIITELPGATDRALFNFAMSTWWLSVDQLHYLLKKGGGDLWDSLNAVRHLTTRSGDLVYELKRSLTLNEVGNAMLNMARQTGGRAMV